MRIIYPCWLKQIRPCIKIDSAPLSTISRGTESLIKDKNHKPRRKPDPKRDQTLFAFRPNVNPEETSILLFPGQASQYVGMGKELLHSNEAAAMFAKASEIVGYDVLDVCLNGPIDKLNSTEVCQVATVVCSVAALVKLREENPEVLESCIGTAGFSVGEFSALVFAGILSFEDAVRLVHARGLAMKAICSEVSSGMMTVFLSRTSKLEFAMFSARKYCEQRLGIKNPVCSVSNYLFPEVKAIGGNSEALKFINDNTLEFGIKRVKMLPVSGAFHTYLMKPAVDPFYEVLKTIRFRSPIVPVYSNVDCKPLVGGKRICSMLVQHLYKPVRWEQILHVLYHRPAGANFPKTYEVGPGSQLGTILKMVNKKAFENYQSD